MFWTTFKLAFLTLLVAWLATARGQVDVAWGAWQLTARPGAMLVLLLLSMLLVVWGGRFFREVWSLPRNVGLWRRTRQRDAGYRALLQALSDEGTLDKDSGCGVARLEKALKARKLLGKDSLSTLIAAQVAEAASSFEQAQTLYEHLQSCPDTRFVASLSLARLARHKGAFERARAYAREAEALRASSLQLWIEQIEIARQSDAPEDALSVLDKIRLRGATLPAKFQNLEASLRIDAMRKAMEQGDEKDALHQARLAYLSSPRRGIVAYAQRLADGGIAAQAQARKLVRARWAEFEGRALAEVFFRLHAASEPIERARLLESLCGKQSSKQSSNRSSKRSLLTSRLLLCELLLDARVWARSTQMLEDLAGEIEEERGQALRQADILAYNALRARLAKEAHNDLEGQKYWLGRCAEQANLLEQQHP